MISINIAKSICVIILGILVVKLTKKIIEFVTVRRAISHVGSAESHWFWGNTNEFSEVENVFPIMENHMKIFPKVKRRVFGPFLSSITVYWPSVLKRVFNCGAGKPETFYNLIRPWLGDGLALSSGKKWERNRKLLASVFHTEMLKKYLQVFNEVSLVLIDKLKDKTTVDFYEVFTLMTFDAILQCALSLKTNCQLETDNTYVNCVQEISKIFQYRGKNPLLWNDFIFSFTSTGKKNSEVLKVLHKYSGDIIRDRKKNLDKINSESLDFLGVLLLAKDDNGEGLKENEIQNEVDTFLFAAQDTTATALSWILYHLACNPKHQDICRKEVQAILNGRKRVEWKDLSKMTYLTMCVKETMRISPPAYSVSKELTKPTNFTTDFQDDQYNLSNTPLKNCSQTFPKSTVMEVNIFNVHRNPNIWKDPHQFDPNRFTKENLSKLPAYSYLPFSAGPRVCIGQNFAMIQIKVTVALLLSRFRFSFDNNFQEPVPLPQLTLKPKNGVHLLVNEI